MSNSSDALLRETLHSVLLAFEAPPSVVDNFRLDNVGSDPFTWTQSFYNFIRIEDGFGLKIKVLFILVGM